MIWQLHAGKTRPAADLRRHIERKLQFALARFSGHVAKVMVLLRDVNGPRGGVDKSCRILAKVRGCGVVVADVVDTTWHAAVDRAADRIGRTVARGLERRRADDRTSRGRPQPADLAASAS